MVIYLLTNNFSAATRKVYDYLYSEIIDNRLKPGTALSEVEISKSLHSSRSPVREAMMALENEGFVRRYPGRGCFVREITMRDVAEIFELRIILENAALARSYQYIDLDALERVEAEIRHISPDSTTKEYVRLDRQFHELITDNCGNERLMSFLHTLSGQIEWVRRLATAKPQRFDQFRQEHLALIDALKREDVELAQRLLTEHIRNVQASTEIVCIGLAAGGASASGRKG